MGHFLLRKATGNDAAFFYDVKKNVLQHYIEKIWGWDEDFQQRFHAANFHVEHTYIIVVNGEDAGTLEVHESKDSIFISSLYILPAFQRKGIGTAIVTDYTNKAAAVRKRVELEVLKLNEGAQRLYKRLGFILSERDDTKYFIFKDCSQ